MTDKTTHPPALWAQRRDVIFFTIELPDVHDERITLEEQKLSFRGKGGDDKKTYELDFEFYGPISVPESKQKVGSRQIEFTLRRKEPGAYWPRLLKDKVKQHWLKIDFNKWKDEDEDDEEEDPRDLDQMLKDMGGINDAMPNMDDINDEEESDDSDDDDMPDLEEDKSDDKTEEAKDS